MFYSVSSFTWMSERLAPRLPPPLPPFFFLLVSASASISASASARLRELVSLPVSALLSEVAYIFILWSIWRLAASSGAFKRFWVADWP